QAASASTRGPGPLLPIVLRAYGLLFLSPSYFALCTLPFLLFPSQRLSRIPTGRRARFEHDLPVDPHRAHADRLRLRRLERRAIRDAIRIEQHEVGEEAGLQRAALRDPDILRRERRHLADRFLEREEVLIAHVRSS